MVASCRIRAMVGEIVPYTARKQLVCDKCHKQLIDIEVITITCNTRETLAIPEHAGQELVCKSVSVDHSTITKYARN